MSIFTSLVTDVLTVQRDPGHTITIRKLAPKHLDEARAAAQLEAQQVLLNMGGPEFIRQLRDALPRSPDGAGGDGGALRDSDDQTVLTIAAATAVADPLKFYDRVRLIQYGVVAWSYNQPTNDRTVCEDIDEDTQEWLARAILRLSKPALFESAEEAEARRKND